MSHLAMLRRELATLDESIRDDELYLDGVIAAYPGIRGRETADLRERIAEGRVLRDRIAGLIRRMDADWLSRCDGCGDKLPVAAEAEPIVCTLCARCVDGCCRCDPETTL